MSLTFFHSVDNSQHQFVLVELSILQQKAKNVNIVAPKKISRNVIMFKSEFFVDYKQTTYKFSESSMVKASSASLNFVPHVFKVPQIQGYVGGWAGCVYSSNSINRSR
jgi:hypothetical protein